MKLNEYREVIVIDGSDPSNQVYFKSKAVIKAILTAFESAVGNKLDKQQIFIFRKVVLDEINDLEKLSQVFLNANHNDNYSDSVKN